MICPGHYSRFAFTVILFLLSACGRYDAQQTPTSQAQVDKLEMEVESLKKQLESQQAEITEVSRRRFMDILARDQYQSATFDPAANEIYSRVDTTVGPFLMTVHAVSPNADGVKVILNLGNITTARYSGGKLHVKWATREPDQKMENYSSAYTKWIGSIQEREITFTESLIPGRWNKVTVVLPGVQANKFGYLNVSMEVSQLQLMQ